MKRWIGTTTAAAVLVLATAVPAAAANDPQPLAGPEGTAGTFTFATSDAAVDALYGPAHDLHVSIDTRLYLPTNATAATPQPAILMTHGFGLDKTSAEIVTTATYLAKHGYVVLTYTSSGFGASGGCVEIDHTDYDVAVAKDLLDVLQARPEVAKDATGAKVGILGGSYGGGLDAIVAETDPRVRAIVPGRTWNSLQYALDPNNYVAAGQTRFDHQANTAGVFKQQWTSLFLASGNMGAAQGKGGCTGPLQLVGGVTSAPANVPCGGFRFQICQIAAQLQTTGTVSDADRAYIAGASAGSRIAQLRVPTLLVQGQRDTLFNLNDSLATYTALQRAGTPVSMIWMWGGHGGYDSQPGEGEAYDGSGRPLDGLYLPRRTLGWFDRWLRAGPAALAGPGFAWYRDGVTLPAGQADASPAYGTAAGYPAMPDAPFALSATGELLAAGTPSPGTATLVNPPGGLPAAYSETSNFTGPSAMPRVPLPPTEIPLQNAAWTTAPVAADTEIVGAPHLHVHLSHTAPGDLVLYAKLYDVAPDGTTDLLRRLIAPSRIPTAALGGAVDLDLLALAVRLPAGHRLQLVLATTDQTSYNNRLPDVITVTTGGADPATFFLPLAAAPAVAFPAPPAAAQPPVTTPPAATPPPARSGPGLAATGAPSGLAALAGLLLAAGAASARRRRRG